MTPLKALLWVSKTRKPSTVTLVAPAMVVRTALIATSSPVPMSGARSRTVPPLPALAVLETSMPPP